jgi:hypothetical protein
MSEKRSISCQQSPLYAGPEISGQTGKNTRGDVCWWGEPWVVGISAIGTSHFKTSKILSETTIGLCYSVRIVCKTNILNNRTTITGYTDLGGAGSEENGEANRREEGCKNEFGFT